jgi:serine/threonine protein kinase
LHRHKLRHRDIKPENILVHNGVVLLTDFDCSHDWSNVTHSWTDKPPPRTFKWAAPEVVNFNGQKNYQVNSKSDIWSLGCVFLVMITIVKEKSPEEFTNQFQISAFHADPLSITQWIRELRKIEIHSQYDSLLDLIERMLQPIPGDRPTAHDFVIEALNMPQQVFCEDCMRQLS